MLQCGGGARARQTPGVPTAVRAVLVTRTGTPILPPRPGTVHHDLDDDLELALRAARAAGAAVMPAFRTEQEVRYKGADQPVTAADLEADRVLAEVLRGARPDYGWLSEETADDGERLARRCTWVVDPIDGTSSFVKGIAEFAVLVGLVCDGRPVLGVVHNPATGETYHAAAGRGAFRNGEPVRVSGAPPPGVRPRLAGSRWDVARGPLAPLADAWELVPLGSTAYKMVKVADGTADGYLAHGRKAEWDVCAPGIIVVEAGGTITRLDGGAVRYNLPQPEWTGLAVSNGRVHAALLAAARGP
jgi:myo-inositol-1(or 4)-monophosphatase